MKYQEPEIVIPELEAAEDTRRKFWSAQDKAVLRKYRDKDPKAIAKYLGRTEAAVRSQLAKLDGGE